MREKCKIIAHSPLLQFFSVCNVVPPLFPHFPPTYLLWSYPAALLEAVPLSAQHLIDSMLFLARVLSLATGHLLFPISRFGISYHLMSAIPSLRLSFALK